MKKLLFLIFTSTILFLASCASEDGADRWVHYSDLGVIESVGDGKGYYFIMTRDDGATLIAVENLSPEYELHEGKRVYCAYEIIDTEEDAKGNKTCYISALGFDEILAKPLVRLSFVMEDHAARADSIGTDLIQVISAWPGGGHLNIEFQYMKAVDRRTKHMITLVWDDTEAAELLATDNTYPGKLYELDFYLHHNAFGEIRENQYDMETAAGFISVPISETIPADAQEVTIRLHYNWSGNATADSGDECLEKTYDVDSMNAGRVIIKATGDNLIFTPSDAIIHLE